MRGLEIKRLRRQLVPNVFPDDSLMHFNRYMPRSP